MDTDEDDHGRQEEQDDTLEQGEEENESGNLSSGLLVLGVLLVPTGQDGHVSTDVSNEAAFVMNNKEVGRREC